jgi:hypothetical protein
MKLVKTTENNNLRDEDLSLGHLIKRVCFVSDYKTGISKYEEGFYTLYVKTEDGTTVRAQIFNIARFIESGLELISLKSKFIELECIPQIHAGQYSLIVENIYTIDQQSIKSPEKFLGIVEDVENLYKECVELINRGGVNMLSPVYTSKHYSSIYNDKIGGYIKFIWEWYYNVGIYSNEFSEQDRETILEVLKNCVVHYGRYLDRISLLDVITLRDKLDILKQLPASVKASTSDVMEDALQSILGIGEPEHLLAHIVYSAFKQTEYIMKIKEEWKSIPLGGVSVSEKRTLKKYC